MIQLSHRQFFPRVLFAIVFVWQPIAYQSQAGEPWSADPAVVAKLSASRPEFIYEESRVPAYTLPNPLGLKGRGQIYTAKNWDSLRQETLETFRSEVYGRRPDLKYQVRFEMIEEKSGLFGIDAKGKSMRVVITSGNESYSFPMWVFLPATTHKHPAVLHINNREFPSFEKASTEPDEFWPVKDIVGRGFVACAVSTVAIDPDRADGFSDGIRGFFHRTSGAQEPPGDDAWKALSAWGWGASRALDYLLTCNEVDPNKIAVIGHSRAGKAALWAAAEDTRFAIACSNNSGCGGAALSRRAFGETVARITKSFPHWFCDRFSKYAGQEASLPVDQHQLFALIAPRPVYATSASDDLWADPRGEYLSMVAASPVYQLFSESALTYAEMPALNEPRIAGKMGYHIRPGAHGLTLYDWTKFLDFCVKQF